MNPKKILFFILYWILISGIIQSFIIRNEFIPFISDLLVFYLAFTKMPNKLNDVVKIVSPLIVHLFAILLIGSSIISFLNLTPPITILWGLRMVIRYLLLFILIFKYFDVRDISKYRNILLKFFWINAFLVFLQYFVLGMNGDIIGSSFTNNGELFVFNLFCTFILSKEYFEKRLKLKYFLSIIIVEIFTAMAAEIKIMYFTIPLAIYAVYVFIKKFSITHVITLIIAYFCLIPAMKTILLLMYNEQYVNKVFNIEAIEKETKGSYNLSENAANISFNRSTCVEKATLIILKDEIHKLGGYGIGSANTSNKFKTWISQQYSSTTSYNWFTSSWLLIEYGWIGYSIWILILISLIGRYAHFYVKASDRIVKSWSALGFISALFTFIIAWYNNMPYYNAYFIYFFWAICFIAIRERLKQLRLK